ncbi:MAG TPA: tetratricopeptide repeat protein, partial [Polyangiaceae bacterium LLY-WYZ-15_(1-7)]|nr:tetratricopeptide repeat protein [Polyangiaceae bacterium LLY-WYZ-15_(1-7)]
RQRLAEAAEEVLGDDRTAEFVHFLGAFLDLPFEDSPFTRAVSDDPQQSARVSQAVLRRFFELDAQRQPLVLTFEDLHYAQDDSLDLVQYLMGALRGAPILVVCVSRPELLARRADWGEGLPQHQRVELSPLGPDDAATLMLKLLEPAGDVPDEVVDAAVDVAGGTPYLLEQMVRAFFEGGTITAEADGSWAVHPERLEDAQLPLTVEDAISARISSLAPAERELLEKASTMGGVFWLGALVALSRIDADAPDLWGGHESQLAYYREALESLAERDYVLPMPDSSIPGEPEFAFKHNLERETLHRLTHRHRMRRYHRVVAEWLELKLPSRGEEQLELLAQHYDEAGLSEQAARAYLDAGDRARSRYANGKAAEYYRRGLELLGEGDIRRRLEGLHHYGDVLQLAGENEGAKVAFREMLEIAFRLDQKAKGGVAHNRLGRLYRSIGQLDEAMRHLGTGQALFEAAGDARGVASSIDDIGKVHWMRGNYEAAERFLQRALEQRQALGDRRSIALSHNNLGLVYQDSGRFTEAKEAFQEALHLRREIGDRPGIAQTLNNLGTIHQDDGDHARAVEVYEAALEEARAVGDRMRQAVILTNLGESHYRMDRPTEAIETLKSAEEIGATLGDRILEGEILRGLAKAHMLIHDFGVARDYVARSIELFEQARGKPFLGVALRTLGEIAAAAGWGGEDHAQAKEAFRRSIALFEELGNEIELASSLEAYAGFLEKASDGDSVVAHEAMQLRGRADAIRQRLRASESYDLEPLEGEKTDPGIEAG